MKTLFITWDGPGPNYLESLFIPIFQDLQLDGVADFELLQYAWGASKRTDSIRRTAEASNMAYSVFKVWQGPQPISAPAMIFYEAFRLVRYVRKNNIKVIMPRSILPAAIALIALKFLKGVSLLYDADGLKADERVDFGGWKQSGLAYKTLIKIESSAVERATVVVTRTHRAKKIISRRSSDINVEDKIVVISNGKSSSVFDLSSQAKIAETRKKLGISDYAPVVAYAGSLGPHYHPERMIKFFQLLYQKRKDAHLLVLSGTPDIAINLLEKARLPLQSYTVKSVHPSDVPTYLASSDLGLAFREASFSQQAVAPIKVGEYLLCGLPVFCTLGVGDLDKQLDSTVGRLTDSLSDESLESGVNWFLSELLVQRERYRVNCRNRGLDYFSLKSASEKYSEAFALINDSYGRVYD